MVHKKNSYQMVDQGNQEDLEINNTTKEQFT